MKPTKNTGVTRIVYYFELKIKKVYLIVECARRECDERGEKQKRSHPSLNAECQSADERKAQLASRCHKES
jgi:hypothetical protein